MLLSGVIAGCQQVSSLMSRHRDNCYPGEVPLAEVSPHPFLPFLELQQGACCPIPSKQKGVRIPAWKRLKILQGILWHRVHIQHRSPDFLLELEKTLKKFVVHEKIRSMPSQEEIDGIVGKINPNEPDVIQLLRRALRAKGHAYNTEIAYVKKVVAFMADELGKNVTLLMLENTKKRCGYSKSE